MMSSNCMLNCTRTKLFLLFVAFIVSSVVYALYISSYASSSYLLQSILSFPKSRTIKSGRNSMKYILLWNTFYGTHDFYFGLGHKPFLEYKCPISDCVTTNNRSLVQHFDAVVFHPTELQPDDMPTNRTPSELYTLMIIESVVSNPEPLSDFYNISMTYRLDSDVSLPYFYSHQYRDNYSNKTFIKLESKPNFCAWFVSNCYSTSRRYIVAHALLHYIKIDIYGKCGHFVCPRSNETMCNELLRGYKFYLSFENSLCPDYVTEKLYRALNNDVIPVVYGSADYSKFAPPHSYINVRDFSSIKELARYLILLSENEVLYNEYFWWKRKEFFKSWFTSIEAWKAAEAHGFCKLCELLHTENNVPRHLNVSKWWHNAKCEKASDVLRSLNIRPTIFTGTNKG